MKLLIFTQKIDKNDPILGFFCDWVVSFASRVESLAVICLEKGEYPDLPKNVTVYSLGKEGGNFQFSISNFQTIFNKIKYLINLYKYLFLIRGSYDSVFVHMNQEYILLAGLYWKLKNIKIYFWRNHPRGSIKTRMAVALSTKVFCTSTDSFTARFKKTIIMPVGVNTSVFKPIEGVVRKKYSVCVVGRIAPIKRVDKALEAMKDLVSSGVQISMNIIGSSSRKDFKYHNILKKYVADNNLSTSVSFTEAVDRSKLIEIYSGHEICLNLTESGSFDKTIVESAACGAIPLVSNWSLKGLLPEVCITETRPQIIADSLQKLLNPRVRVEIQKDLESFVKSQSLETLMEKLLIEI